MKRTERIGALIKILSDEPCKVFSLNYFCRLFDAAKSSVSEDLHIANEVLASMELGFIETTSGAGGGVRYIPHISNEKVLELQNELCARLSEKNRVLGGGFLYTSDIMCDGSLMRRVATIFARRFCGLDADYVATIETKGIPVASMTAYLLNLPLVVIRRETKISEGSTVSINYFSGSYDRVQKMSIAKRAVEPGGKAIIIDDFMRGGGSIKGISEILAEFDVSAIGTGVIIVNKAPEKKKISDYVPIVCIEGVDEDNKIVRVVPNESIF